MTAAKSKLLRGTDKSPEAQTDKFGPRVRFDHLDPDDIAVSSDRLRKLDMGVAEALARSFELVGQLQPILVAVDDAGQHHLKLGLHRRAAAKLTGRTVEAKIVHNADWTAHQNRLAEIFENIIRPDLKALERAVFLAELKRLHEEMYPESRNGGDRRSAVARARADQNEIFSFSSLAAERTGLTERAIQLSIAIAKNLSPALQEELMGTWLASHQAGLQLLSQQTPELQRKIVDLLFEPVETRRAETVQDALLLAKGIAPKRPADRHWQVLTNKMARSSREQRQQLFGLYEDEIVDFVKSKGLV